MSLGHKKTRRSKVAKAAASSSLQVGSSIRQTQHTQLAEGLWKGWGKARPVVLWIPWVVSACQQFYKKVLLQNLLYSKTARPLEQVSHSESGGITGLCIQGCALKGLLNCSHFGSGLTVLGLCLASDGLYSPFPKGSHLLESPGLPVSASWRFDGGSTMSRGGRHQNMNCNRSKLSDLKRETIRLGTFSSSFDSWHSSSSLSDGSLDT